jgi:ankyrin repeat protein
MKSQLIAIVAAVLVVGCGPTEPNAPKGSVHIYAQEGDIAAVKQHLAAGTDVNAKDDFIGMTILQSAALGGQKEIVEFLIAEGADVNAMGRTFLTPLDTALKASLNKEIADLLRKHGGKTGEELKAEDK